MIPRLEWTRWRAGRYTSYQAGYVIERAPGRFGQVWRITYNGQPIGIAVTLAGAKAFAAADAADRRQQAGQV